MLPYNYNKTGYTYNYYFNIDEENIFSTLKDIDDAIKNSKDREEEIEKAPKKLSILCAGATGVGKSTLINALIGSKADSLHVGHSLCQGTLKVTERTFSLRGITVTIWDTPGLQRSEADRKYLEEIKEKCADFDIFLYCIKADETRASELSSDSSSFQRYTKLFGPELWKKAVVALTFSNKIEDHWEDEAENNPNFVVEREFTRIINQWERKIRGVLAWKIMDKKSADHVPVLPTGIAGCRDLPGYKFWLSRLFASFEDRIKRYRNSVI